MSAEDDFRAANAWLREGRFADAEAAYRRALTAAPGFGEAWYNLGVALRDQGRPGEAEAAFRQSVALRPSHPESYNNLGLALMAQKRTAEAVACFQTALTHNPKHARAFSNLGVARLELDDLEGAVEAFAQAAALKPDYARAHNNLGVALQALGRLEDAGRAFQAALDADPTYAEALFNRNGLGKGPDDEAQQIAKRLVEERDPVARSTLLFALGRALERRGEYEAAFDAWSEANALRRAHAPFDIAGAERRMAAIAERFDAGLLERAEGKGADSDRPIFIVGMPRSGTTLVEQIISAHPDVEGGGELLHMARIASGPASQGQDWRALGEAYLDALPQGSPRVTDKAIDNFQHIGLIAAVLPNAVIVHCRRDARDVGLSCFSTRFTQGQEFTNDLGDLGRYWRAYDRLMEHWRAVLAPGRMLEVSYEALVEDLEGWTRRMLDHCGLAFDAACLRFHESDRPVRTASVAQVRRPIYASSVGRWRNYEARLGPLIEALGE